MEVMFRSLTGTLVIFGLLLVAACSAPRTRDPGYHHVRPGETLYSIAFSYGLDYHDVARWNGIGPSYAIYAGQRLSLIPPDKQRLEPKAYYSKPVDDKSIGAWTPDKPRHRPASPKPASATPPPKRPPPENPPRKHPPPAVKVAKKPNPKPPARPKSVADPTKWQWPTQGGVVTRFSPSHGKKGIDIKGKPGQAIQATAGGEVVYSGKGLIGYGNLIIASFDKFLYCSSAETKSMIDWQGTKNAQIIMNMTIVFNGQIEKQWKS